MSDAARVAQQFVQGVAVGDVDQVMSTLHPELQFTVPNGLPYGGTFRGHDGFGKYLGALAAVFDIVDISAEAYETAGPVASRIDVTFVSRATGRRLSTKMVELYTVEDGLIKGIEPFYYDTGAVADLYHER